MTALGLCPPERPRAGSRRRPSRRCFALVVLLLIALAVLEAVLLARGLLQPAPPAALQLSAELLTAAPLRLLPAPAPGSLPAPAQPNCSHFSCVNVYRCGGAHRSRIAVYVYPYQRYETSEGRRLAPLSREYYDVLRAVQESAFYTEDPAEACLFVPALDTLANTIDRDDTALALASLPYWEGGENHLIFSQWPADGGERLGRALLAAVGFSSTRYRYGFDVSLPSYGPAEGDPPSRPSPSKPRRWRLVVALSGLSRDLEHATARLAAADVSGRTLVLRPCGGDQRRLCSGATEHRYWETLQSSEFCAVGAERLRDALRAGCVPVLTADLYVPPFSEVVDWTRLAVRVHQRDLPRLSDILDEVSDWRRRAMAAQGGWVYDQYLRSFREMALTTLQIVNDRILPHVARSYEAWNDPPELVSPGYPLTVPYTSPRSQGFTAVILTYDRLDSLHQIIEAVARAPSLAKVLVVWNNQEKPPPDASLWPRISRPLKVIHTSANLLSNRFFPYAEIETEGVLALDDDITMLTTDELEFGYQVWREFPDRIVGFPSRNHVWNNVTGNWAYDSEWTSKLSMVLTGAAFYHKYWNYRYTHTLPGNVKTWVDDNMNCEDIAMNFLVSNVTGKAPIKVAARKKFKCTSSDCTGGDLSTNQDHFMERSECIQHFVQAFGAMPLQHVEFRADPVLYKDTFPHKLKRYNDVGSL